MKLNRGKVVEKHVTIDQRIGFKMKNSACVKQAIREMFRKNTQFKGSLVESVETVVNREKNNWYWIHTIDYYYCVKRVYATRGSFYLQIANLQSETT